MIRELFRVSLWCLFLALAMNTAFTYSQGLASRGWDLPWLEIRSTLKNVNYWNTQNTVITTTKKPVVVNVASRYWEIYFVEP